MAVRCEFPAEIQVEKDGTDDLEFAAVRFRNGETMHLTPWGAAVGFREWRKLRKCKTMPAKGLLELRPDFRAPIIERIGERQVIKNVSMQKVFDLDDRELRKRLIGNLTPLEFLGRVARDRLPLKVVGEPDDYGELYSVSIPEDEDYRVVKVVNATPEPDGTFKDYFLRLPPWIESPRAAVAWTFGMEEAEYDPIEQT